MPRRPLSRHLRVQVLARDGYRCLMCGRSKEEVALEVGHVIPVADGGTDELHNLATLCRDCNGGKSAYRFTDYRSVTVISRAISDFLVMTALVISSGTICISTSKTGFIPAQTTRSFITAGRFRALAMTPPPTRRRSSKGVGQKNNVNS